MSNTGWTPAAPGHTGGSEAGVTSGDDALAEQVVDLDVRSADGDTIVVRVSGEVDMLTTPVLSSTIDEQFEAGPRRLVIDMSGVGFLGSSGLAALVSARDEAHKRDVTLRLVSADHAVLRPLTATGLAELFDIYPDLDSALGGPRVSLDDGPAHDA